MHYDLYPRRVETISLDHLNRELGGLVLSEMYADDQLYARLQSILDRAIAAAAAGDFPAYQEARREFKRVGHVPGHDDHLAHRIVQWLSEYYWAEQTRIAARKALGRRT